MKQFIISVIIPIYNVEKYLEKTIDSVVNQSIGFLDNIQLILINDGSLDNSEEICLKYKNLYPDNVVYFKQDNAGVSAARNKGIELSTGLFTTMLDSDDLWSKDAFKQMYNAYLSNKDINIFSCKMVFFDKKKGSHPLNYKYKENKVINILEDYDYPQLSSSSIFIKTDVVKKYRYELGIKYSEDNRFINEILMDEKIMMMLKDPIYYYRRRETGDSAIQGSSMKEDWYLVTPVKSYKYLIDLSKEKFGKVIPYIQNVVCYEITWRVVLNPKYDMDDVVRNKYKNILLDLLSNIDDDIIINQRFMNYATICFLLNVKNNTLYHNDIVFDGDYLLIGSRKIDKKKVSLIEIDQTYLRDNKLICYGKLDRRFLNKDDFHIQVDDKDIGIKYYDLTIDFNEKTFTQDNLHDYIGIYFEVDYSSYPKICFYYDKNKIAPYFCKNSILTNELPISYHNDGKYTFVFDRLDIVIQKRNIFKSFGYELKNDIFLLKKRMLKPLVARLAIKLGSIFKFRELWIISDRVLKADDNGEHFFRYMTLNHKDKNCYFALAYDSVDYDRLSKIGKVIDPNSNKYKLMFGRADYVVSSQAENYVFNPLGTGNECVRDQYHFKYVFLQHGIIKDDLSPWLNVNTKKMDMFVTSAEREYESLLKYKYYYGPEVVKLTGLPRYDTLREKEKLYPTKNRIMLSLTWRTGLASLVDKESGDRDYNPDFKKSDYFKFINNLMNDKRLLKVLKDKDYKIRFIPHPNVLIQLKDFDFNDYIEVEKDSINYQKEFCLNKLLITDYSSVFFDFCYLKKPVIYYQADREVFYKEQLYDKGYFEYEKDGFGPVFKDYDKFVDGLINIINNDCKLSKTYEKRIDDFFKYNDSFNCERVYEEIIKL